MAETTTRMSRKYGPHLVEALQGEAPKSPLQQTALWLKTVMPLDDEDFLARGDLLKLAEKAGIAVSWIDPALMDLKVDVKVDDNEGVSYRRSAPEEAVNVIRDAPEVTVSQVNPAANKCEDYFSLTDEERQEYGIKDNEQPCWIRDPRWWDRHVPGNSIPMWKRGNPGGRVITVDGQYVTNGEDLILACRPVSEVEKLLDRERKADQEIREENSRTRRNDDFNVADKDFLIEQAARNSQQNHEMGLIGVTSPSQGLEYEAYIKNRGLTEADIQEEAEKYALGPMYAKMVAIREEEDEAERQGRRGGRGGGRTYSIPQNVRPRNLRKPEPANA